MLTRSGIHRYALATVLTHRRIDSFMFWAFGLRPCAVLAVKAMVEKKTYRGCLAILAMAAGLLCLAGPVYAGAVILGDYAPAGLDDSKALLPEVREDLTRRIEANAVVKATTAVTATTAISGALPLS